MLENKSKHWIEKIKRTRDEKEKIDIKCRLTHEKQIEIRCRHLKKDNIIKALPWNKTPSRNRDSLKDDSRHKEEMRIRAGLRWFERILANEMRWHHGTRMMTNAKRHQHTFGQSDGKANDERCFRFWGACICTWLQKHTNCLWRAVFVVIKTRFSLKS